MEQELIIEIERIMTESRFQFAIKCMHKVTQIMRKSDIAFSPHSIYEGLLLVYFMSSGAIEERLKLILCLSNVPKYHLITYYLLGREFDQSEFQINASAASSHYGIERRCWIKATNFNHLLPLKTIFNNGFEVFNPDNSPIQQINRINVAIQIASENYINFTVGLKAVRHDMELVLMTVSRLNAQQFQISNCESDALNEPMLGGKRMRRTFFSDELNMSVSEFPYANENRSLFVFIPPIKSPAGSSSRMFIDNGVSNLIERFSTEEGISTLRNLLDSVPSEDAYSEISGIEPIFSLERDVPLLPLLEAFGIDELLRPDAINLDSLFVNDDSVHLGNAMHRICVKVHDMNTTAGAINVFYTGQEVPSLGMKTSIGYDYPFAWLIYDKRRRNVLFAGAFDDFEYSCNIDQILTPSSNFPVLLDTDENNL